ASRRMAQGLSRMAMLKTHFSQAAWLGPCERICVVVQRKNQASVDWDDVKQLRARGRANSFIDRKAPNSVALGNEPFTTQMVGVFNEFNEFQCSLKVRGRRGICEHSPGTVRGCPLGIGARLS